MLNGFRDRKYFHTVTFIILAGIIFIGGAYLVFAYKTLDNLVNEMMTIISNQGVMAVESNIENEISKTEYISNSKIIRNVENSTAEMFYAIDRMTTYDNNNVYVLINEEGVAISSEGTTFDASGYDFFKKSMNGEANISDPMKLKSGEWICFAVVPYYDLGDNISGCFARTFPAEKLNSIIAELSIFEEDTTFIIDSEGEIIAGVGADVIDVTTNATINLSDENLSAEYASLEEFINNTPTGESGKGEYVFNGEKRLAVYQPIELTDWTFVTAIPKKLVYADVYTFLILIAAGIAIVGLFIFFLFLYSKKLKKNLYDERDKFYAAVNVANLFTLEISNSGMILNVNENFLEVTGYSRSEVLNQNLENFVLKEQWESCKAQAKKIYNNEIFDDFEASLIKKDGSQVHLLWNSLLNENKQSKDMIYVIGTNITNIKEYQNKIHKLAYYDTLTDLKNRTSLEEYVNDKINRNENFAIIYLDFDNFKFVNDSFGHSMGDKYLLDVCNRIVDKKKEDSSVFRVGGDEIVVVCDNVEDFKVVGDYANTIMEIINMDYYINEIKINTSCSIGISRYPKDGNDYGEIFKAAEIAMNKAKNLGKARIVFYNSNMDRDLINSILIENDLRDAVKNSDFTLYYQPQYYIDTGELYGFEALIRWTNHPVKGFVSPAEFIPIAEKTQLIIPIGEWVLKEALKFSAKLNSDDGICIPISVNVSSVQIANEDFVESVTNILSSNKVKYDSIKFELTESVIMESIDKNLIKVEELNAKGIKFALDDFGTGYSSLTYLKKLPIQLLKIDKSFVDSILDKSDEDKDILSLIILLSHNLNIQVVAEGVEQEEQVNWLKNKGCNIVQGYYSGRPVSEEDAMKLLGTNFYKMKGEK